MAGPGSWRRPIARDPDHRRGQARFRSMAAAPAPTCGSPQT